VTQAASVGHGDNFLDGITSTARGDIWASGHSVESGGKSRSLILHLCTRSVIVIIPTFDIKPRSGWDAYLKRLRP
jgi:hypothetical protein